MKLFGSFLSNIYGDVNTKITRIYSTNYSYKGVLNIRFRNEQ
jgi:hypothetical protein